LRIFFQLSLPGLAVLSGGSDVELLAFILKAGAK